MSDVGVFTGECGQNSSARGVLAPNQTVELNGSTDLSNCIQFNDNGKVYSIKLTKEASSVVYTYTLLVDSEGPEGAFSGGGHLSFEDEAGDTYKLYIYVHERKTHAVSYNSEKPNIVKIVWND